MWDPCVKLGVVFLAPCEGDPSIWVQNKQPSFLQNPIWILRSIWSATNRGSVHKLAAKMHTSRSSDLRHVPSVLTTNRDPIV